MKDKVSLLEGSKRASTARNRNVISAHSKRRSSSALQRRFYFNFFLSTHHHHHRANKRKRCHNDSKISAAFTTRYKMKLNLINSILVSQYFRRLAGEMEGLVRWGENVSTNCQTRNFPRETQKSFWFILVWFFNHLFNQTSSPPFFLLTNFHILLPPSPVWIFTTFARIYMFTI